MRPKHRLRQIGLCLKTAFAFAVITAASAQAEDWLGQTNAVTNELVTASKPSTLSEDKMATLVTSAGGTPVKILCNKQSGAMKRASEVSSARFHG